MHRARVSTGCRDRDVSMAFNFYGTLVSLLLAAAVAAAVGIVRVVGCLVASAAVV